jgi:hypothetical protein
MNVSFVRRWFQSAPKGVLLAAVFLLMFVVAIQSLNNARLRALVTRFQASQEALLRERAYLKDHADAWEAEAVGYRVKYGEPEGSSDPPLPNEADREIIFPPSGE